MDITPLTQVQKVVQRDTRTKPHYPCPICGEELVLLRGLLRCRRCYYSLCESCGGGVEEE